MRIHPLGRFFFSLSLFAAVLMMNKAWAGAGLLFLAMLLIRLTSASWLPLWRALRLLLWLLIPIILLHLMFTPGRLLWPDSVLSFSREGLDQGLWLALHLCALFFAAMALSRSLKIEEWGYYSIRLPLIGKQMLPFVQLAAPMRQMVSEHLKQQKIRPFRHLPTMLVTLFEAVWHGAQAQADLVWKQWGQEPQHAISNGGVFSAMLLALCGIGLLFVSRAV